MIHFRVPDDGTFIARIKMVSYNGFPQAVYRLTIGDVPYVTSVFPPSVKRGESTTVELHGPNVPTGLTQTITAPKNDPFPIQHVAVLGISSGHDAPVICSEATELIEKEPNDQLAIAQELTPGATVNGRFDSADDADWYRIRFPDKKMVQVQVFAHRFTRSPRRYLAASLRCQRKIARRER